MIIVEPNINTVSISINNDIRLGNVVVLSLKHRYDSLIAESSKYRGQYRNAGSNDFEIDFMRGYAKHQLVKVEKELASFFKNLANTGIVVKGEVKVTDFLNEQEFIKFKNCVIDSLSKYFDKDIEIEKQAFKVTDYSLNAFADYVVKGIKIPEDFVTSTDYARLDEMYYKIRDEARYRGINLDYLDNPDFVKFKDSLDSDTSLSYQGPNHEKSRLEALKFLDDYKLMVEDPFYNQYLQVKFLRAENLLNDYFRFVKDENLPTIQIKF